MKQYIEIIKNLFKVAGGKKHLTFLMFFSSAAYNLAGLLPPLATAGIIRMITEEKFHEVWKYAGLYLVFYAIYFAFMRINYYAYTKMAEFYHITLQERIFDNINAHPEVLEKVPKGRVLDSFSDDIRWMVDGVNVAVEATIRVIQLLIIFGIFLFNDLTIGAIAVLVDLLYLLILNANAKREAKGYAAARRAEDKAIGAFNEMVTAKEEASGTRREELGIIGVASEERITDAEESIASAQREKMEKSYPGWKKEYRKKRRAISDRDTLWEGIPYAGKIVLYVLLAKLVIDGTIGLDILVLLIGYFEMTISCMDKLTTHLLDLSNYGVRAQRLKQVL